MLKKCAHAFLDLIISVLHDVHLSIRTNGDEKKSALQKNCPISIMQLLCSCAEVWGPFVASCFLASEGLRRQYPLHHRIVATVINACDHYFHNFHPWDVFFSSISGVVRFYSATAPSYQQGIVEDILRHISPFTLRGKTKHNFDRCLVELWPTRVCALQMLLSKGLAVQKKKNTSDDWTFSWHCLFWTNCHKWDTVGYGALGDTEWKTADSWCQVTPDRLMPPTEKNKDCVLLAMMSIYIKRFCNFDNVNCVNCKTRIMSYRWCQFLLIYWDKKPVRNKAAQKSFSFQ